MNRINVWIKITPEIRLTKNVLSLCRPKLRLSIYSIQKSQQQLMLQLKEMCSMPQSLFIASEFSMWVIWVGWPFCDSEDLKYGQTNVYKWADRLVQLNLILFLSYLYQHIMHTQLIWWFRARPRVKMIHGYQQLLTSLPFDIGIPNGIYYPTWLVCLSLMLWLLWLCLSVVQ